MQMAGHVARSCLRPEEAPAAGVKASRQPTCTQTLSVVMVHVFIVGIFHAEGSARPPVSAYYVTPNHAFVSPSLVPGCLPPSPRCTTVSL